MSDRDNQANYPNETYSGISRDRLTRTTSPGAGLGPPPCVETIVRVGSAVSSVARSIFDNGKSGKAGTTR